MKKILFIIILALIAGGAYYYFNIYQDDDITSPWQLVPDESIAVLEADFSDETTPISLKQHMEQYAWMAPVSEYYTMADSACKKAELPSSAFYKKEALVVWLTERTGNIEPIVITPLEDNQGENVIKKYFASNDRFNLTKQEYRDEHYYRLFDEKTKKAIHLTEKDGYLVMSFTKEMLVHYLADLPKKERIHNALPEYADKEHFEGPFKLYLNYPALFTALQHYIITEDNPLPKKLTTFAQNALLKISLTDESILMNGFTHTPDTGVSYLNCFHHQQPVGFETARYLPKDIGGFIHFGINQQELFAADSKEYFWGSGEKIEEEWERIQKEYDIAIPQLYQYLHGECNFFWRTSAVGQTDRYMLLSTKDKSALQKWLVDAQAKMNKKNGKAVTHKGYTIEPLPVHELPALLFGELFSQFKDPFYTWYNDKLLLSSSKQGMQSLLNEIEAEHVWSKSLQLQNMEEEYFFESNLSIYYKLGDDFIDRHKEWLDESGITFYHENDSAVKNARFVLAQYTKEEERFFTNLIYSAHTGQQNVFADKPEAEEAREVMKTGYRTSLEDSIISKPWVVKNHENKHFEVLVQDSDHDLHLIDHNGKKRWTFALEGPVISKMEQVDIYKNNKLQYLFATPSKIYCLDRLGRLVEHFPIALPEKDRKIQHLSVIDYDGSKNYRLLAADEKGQLHMFNTKGTNLNGWKPNTLPEAPLALPAKHVRVNGKDYIIAITTDGKAHAIQRRGTHYNSFPLDLDKRIISDMAVKKGGSPRSTTLTLLLEGNVSTTFNLAGDVVSKRKIDVERPDTTAISMVKDINDSEYIFYINAPDKAYLLSQKAQKLLDLPINPGAESLLQYYNIDGKIVYAITDPKTRQFYFLTEEGYPILPEEVRTNQEIALLYSSSRKQYYLYLVNGHDVSLLEISNSQ